MATFSLGSTAVTPGAPGVYINERAGQAGAPAIATFSTTYMLVEVEDSVPVTVFPFNTPIPITSLVDYRLLNAGLIPSTRIPHLSYECVNEFFQNAQVGDLRVVRVGTPDQIVEIELLPTGQKQNNTSFPSSLQAGDTVYAQIILNGQQLVAGDGGTGYDPNGNWLGVPVLIPVDYIPGDLVNNRKISRAITDAVSTAVKTNPSIASSIYVRDSGLLVDVDPVLYSLNENGYITLAATSFNGSVSVVTQTNPSTNLYVFTQGTYDVNNIVGASTSTNRVPQDYEQCINTAFDGQQDQGYLITPTAYAQFGAEGRAAVGAAAANLCANNSYKWLALADPGPFLVTDINQYTNYAPHQPAQNLVTGLKYLVDNVIYEWTGVEVTYPRANYQSLVAGGSPQVAITESQNTAGSLEKVGLLDLGSYTASLAGTPALGLLTLSGQNWPVSYQIQKVIVSSATGGFVTAVLPNAGGTIDLNGQTVYAVAPAFNPDNLTLSTYPLNNTWLAQTATQASDILAEVLQNGGTDNQTVAPTSAITFATSGQATISYAEPQWDLQVSINGQTSDLIENITDTSVSYNTLHLPGTLQSSTEDYRLGFTTRTIYNPATTLAAGTTSPYSGAAVFTVASHGLVNGQKVFFTQHITANGETKTLFNATTRLVQVPYYVTVVTTNTFVLSPSLTAYSALSYVPFSGALDAFPTILYTPMYGGPTTAVSLAELETVPLIRGRKYGFASGNITNQAASAAAFVPSGTNPAVTVYLNNSSQVVALQQVSAWGETTDANYLPSLETVAPGTSTTAVDNFYCVPTVEQSFTSQAFLLPTIDPIEGGAYDPAALSTTGPVATLGVSAGGAGGAAGTYALRSTTGGTGTGATVSVTKVASTTGPIATLGAVAGGTDATVGVYTAVAVTGGTGASATVNVTVTAGPVLAVTLNAAGTGYTAGNTLTIPAASIGGTVDATVVVATITAAVTVSTVTLGAAGVGYTAGDTLTVLAAAIGGGADLTVPVATIAGTTAGAVSGVTPYVTAAGITNGTDGDMVQANIHQLTGVYFNVTAAGTAPDGVTPVAIGDRIVSVFNGAVSSWLVVPPSTAGGDLSTGSQVLYGSQVSLDFTPQLTPPAALWRFDAITSTEIINDALRGVGFNGVPQAVLVEAGIDNVTRLSQDSQRYSNPFGFIAYYGPYILNGAGVWLPPSPYVTGVALRRYRAEGYQFPPAGVKYQLADALGAQIPINSAQQNLLNPEGCNAIRTLPGYPQTAVFIWGGRTRINPDDAQQRLYQFVNTRVILNVVYGSLRTAFDTQIFNVIDGFGIVYNQIISVGNSVLNNLYVKGALFGAKPSEAFQVICDERINLPSNLEQGIVNAKVFVTPVPTLERIQIDLIRVAIGNMQNELNIQGLGQNNTL
jgi:hypothetical protein